jgi:signal transduction histidine kinase
VRRAIIAGLLLLLGGGIVTGEDSTWLGMFSGDLRALDRQRQSTRQALERLAAPVIGQTAPQFGHQHQRLSQPPLTPPWVQVDLEEPVPIERIALIPAVLDWQADTKRTYGFPPRFRIDLADSADFARPVPVADFTERDLPDPGIAPLVVTVAGHRARYVRITVTKLAVENDQHFYAIGELLVLSGRRNIAVGRPVTASSGMNLPPRWTMPNLVDGRTPLGPPISVELLPWDGLFAGATSSEPSTSMAVDLGKVFQLQEVRLYATHARLGADIPGFSFPPRFRVEVADSADFADARTILDSTQNDYPNPGDNPITIRTPGIGARHLRIALPPGNQGRFGLSEVEAYSDDRNTSYGRLKELPDWLDEWDQRARLTDQLVRLDAQRPALVAEARRRSWWASGFAGGLVAVAVTVWLVALRRRRARELDGLRRRLARDLHDEIGSNLAAIARLSELGAVQPTTTDSADWQEVNRIAQESMDGMREVLWLAGAREEAGPDLANHLRRLVERMLGGLTVRWGAPLETLPASWSPAGRRELFLFIKEALTNVVRHARASVVDLTLVADRRELRLEIRDDGAGFDPSAASGGMGLTSLRERARTLGGHLVITSAPGRGTHIVLTVPVSRLEVPAAGSTRVPIVGRST